MFLRIMEIAATDHGQAMVAGVCGAIVRVVTLRERKYQAIGSIVVGLISAVYLGPLALPMLESVLGALRVAPQSAGPLSGFLVGLGGITFAQAILRVFQTAGLIAPARGRGHDGES